MNYFKKYNNIVGWVAFAVALIVYVLTAEPTASWWDCMEYTATSYKMEVGHPPGAPLFMMLTRLFTMLSFGNTAAVGFASNLMSCVASAFCILFMFWTITRLARKMLGEAGGNGFDAANKTRVWTAISAGFIGSVAYAFTDSFWFSAVESEVYATSSMFTALVVWLMLRWEEVADEPHANRWLVLIAYVMGLSIGVHILNLLTIPALVFIYYFRKTPKITWKGVVLALLAAGGILGAIYKIIMPWTVSIGAWVDRMFVNGMGLPANSGMLFWVLLLFVLVGLGVYYTHKKGRVLWNTILLCTGVILIGYGSYASVVIRASANPPMNSNNPDNPYGLLNLLNRSQYGSQPILYGPVYSSMPENYIYAPSYYLDKEGKYEKTEDFAGYKYPSEMKFFFPRMHGYASARDYEDWMGGIKGRNVRVGQQMVKVPTLGENIEYFFSFQLNYMYWRYFMWNFVGRQDDVQGRGNIFHGNWLSGIGPIDALYLGPQDIWVKDDAGKKNNLLPEEIARNKARNKFFFLPFLLGILGLIAQLGADKRGFTIVMWLFVMMGLALVVYFNIVPNPLPRERDYIYAGSFYAFSIWIGLGVLWVQEMVSKLLKKREGLFSVAIATAVCATVPLILCAQGWDDHDRSGRYIGRDLGHNILVSLPPNSIVMNFGDNDSFPVWYNQEVENVRPDVRIMNMSYLGGDWYVEQMHHRYNESAPVPFTLPRRIYTEDWIRIDELIDRPVAAKDVVDFVSSDDPKTKGKLTDGTLVDFIPTRQILLPVDKEAALASGIVKPEDAHLMVDTITFTLPEGQLDKPQLMLLDLLANFDWKRPLCFTYLQLLYEMGLSEWLQADGWVYRLVPIQTPANGQNVGRIDTELSYDLLMNRYKYGNISDPKVYIDYFSLTNLNFVGARRAFTDLALQLAVDGDSRRAVEVLDRSLVEFPHSNFDYDFHTTYHIINAYYAIGANDRGDALLEDYANTLQEYIEYYMQFLGRKGEIATEILINYLEDLDGLSRLAANFGRTTQHEAIEAYLDQIVPAEPGPAAE